MAWPPEEINKISSQPLSVDFIDNRLEKYHPAFRRSASVKYDPGLGCYAPTGLMASEVAMSTYDSAAPGELAPRPELPAAEKMKFWVTVFPEAMNQVKGKPDLELKADFTIREKTNWDDVLAQLQKARESYDGTKKGILGKITRGRRKVMDVSSTVGQVVRVVKGVEYLSTPMAAVEVLLEAAQRASEVREAVTEMPQHLEDKFGIIEVFLATFPGDKNIGAASVKLVVSIFLAIEKAIEFFLKHQIFRGMAALMRGAKYEEKLLDRIKEIQNASDHLIEVARLSKVAGDREAMMALLNGTAKIIRIQNETGIKLEKIDTKVDSIFPRLQNMVKGVFDEAERLVREELEWERRERQKDRQENARQYQEQQETITRLENLVVHSSELLRRLTPSPCPQDEALRRLPPPQQHELPAAQFPGPLPWDSVSHTMPMVLIPSYSPPQPLLWSPQPIRPIGPTQSTPSITVDALLELLRPTIVEERDLEEVLGSRDIISPIYVARAEQVADTPQFRDWAIAAESTELLVEGNFGLSESHYVSALSVLCATITQTLRTRERYISLVFFCGCHPEDDGDDDSDGSSTAGGIPMIKSLIAQLLQQHRGFDMTDLGSHIKEELIEYDDLDKLCVLFSWLVKQLPDRMTLVCIVDGAIHYEIDDWANELSKVVGCLLDLTRNEDIPLPVKVLVTSPTSTERVQELFDTDDDGSYLTLDSLYEGNHVSGMREFEESDGESATYDSDDDYDLAA